MNRLSQKHILPTAVKNRGLGNVVSITENAEASTSLDDGEDTIFTALLINNKDADMIGEPEFSLWETSIAAANLIPNGASIDASKYQIIGPWNEWTEIMITGGSIELPIPTLAIASRIYVRNISVGDATTIVARARMRYITNFDKTSL